jgi:CRP-like cAMP-binding protein/DNA-binding NarL/FixJ family response regulator
MKKILIIEDNEDLRSNTSQLLEIAGYETITASNGKEGLEMAVANKPNLILCDIMMPLLDGYGVLRALDNIPELTGIPFIFMTARSTKADFRKGMDLGADDYLPKPFNGDDLLRIIAARLKKNELLIKKYENNFEGFNSFLNTAKTEFGLDILTEHRTIKKLRKKDMLFMEGDSANFLYFIISGKIKIFKSNESSKEFIIDILKDGDFLGHNALLENGMHKEFAMAIDDSEVALIPKEDFFQLLYTNNEVALKFIKLISRNFTEAEDKLIKLAYDSARKRVAEAILFVSAKYKSDETNGQSFTMQRENLSSLSGISPESVSRNISDFKEEGLIETNNGNIKILNARKLEMLRN